MSGSGLVQQATPCGLDGVRTERKRVQRHKCNEAAASPGTWWAPLHMCGGLLLL